jgi:hypothetical protein
MVLLKIKNDQAKMMDGRLGKLSLEVLKEPGSEFRKQ